MLCTAAAHPPHTHALRLWPQITPCNECVMTLRLRSGWGIHHENVAQLTLSPQREGGESQKKTEAGERVGSEVVSSAAEMD